MRKLRSDGDLERFFPRVRTAPERLLLLDYDGTLAPFQEEPGAAVPYPGVRERITATLRAGGSRVVVVSGRAIRDLLPLLDLPEFPEMWGCHGAERRLPDGSYQLLDLSPAIAEVVAQETAWLEGQGLASRLEHKPVGMVVHWRGMPAGEREALEHEVRARWDKAIDALSGSLRLHAFDGGLELRLPGIDKGQVTRRILDEAPLGVAVAFLGDDLTDEDAFQVLHGRGLAVLVRPEWRTTAADIWLRPPEELLRFLDDWAHAAQEHESHE